VRYAHLTDTAEQNAFAAINSLINTLRFPDPLRENRAI
jgi:hypothetical protein